MFVLIGLQLPTVRAAIRGYSLSTLILDGALLSALLILLRLLWVFPGAYAAYFIRTRLLHQRYPRPPFREVFVVGWTGMRGVVALAAALSLPATLANGQPLPYRNLIIFLTFSVIFVTLVLQGLTLPWIIRLLRLQSTSGSSSEESEVRQASLAAALAHLVQLRSEAAQELWPIYDDLEEHYRRRLAEFDSRDGRAHAAAFLAQHRQLSKELLDVERRTAVEWRDQGRISDDVLRKMEYELDLGQAQLSLPADI